MADLGSPAAPAMAHIDLCIHVGLQIMHLHTHWQYSCQYCPTRTCVYTQILVYLFLYITHHGQGGCQATCTHSFTLTYVYSLSAYTCLRMGRTSARGLVCVICAVELQEQWVAWAGQLPGYIKGLLYRARFACICAGMRNIQLSAARLKGNIHTKAHVHDVMELKITWAESCRGMSIYAWAVLAARSWVYTRAVCVCVLYMVGNQAARHVKLHGQSSCQRYIYISAWAG